eukprot:TRINITY_DN67645_c0_g1_i1.p1 TRINITY_DN67645_c0_g1~~TRINITY_DN67645_c0_g1_i1.p1  ORF type:complete len:592 (+),score=75.82 TRINITY_DN67645_c0_g1_i1:205-1980(+)
MCEDQPVACGKVAGPSRSVNVVFIGPCSCGKSTVAGRLVADCGAVDEQTLVRIAREAAECGQDDRRYAWILDKLRSERDRGGTIFTAVWRLNPGCSRFLVIDAPGHHDYARDTVTAVSQADVAVLVVAAATAGADDMCGQQMCEHIQLAYTLGLRRLVVCVSKMDLNDVAYSEEVFEDATCSIRENLRNVGFDIETILFVPVSGLAGANVVTRSQQTLWYNGPTLLEALQRSAVWEHRQPERPLRIPVREVMQIGGTEGVVAVGRVETGSLTPGMRLKFTPGNVIARVLSVDMHHEQLPRASSGASVNVHVDTSIKELRRGMVGSAADDSPACECSSFLAQLIVLGQPRSGELRVGCVLIVDCHTAQVPCVFEEFLSRTDRRTGRVLEMRPVALLAGDSATVRCRPQEPLCVEPCGECPALGRFAVRDQKTTIAIGVVQEVEQAPALPWTPPGIAVVPRTKTLGSKEFHSSSTHRSVRNCATPAATSKEHPLSVFAAKPKVHGQGSRSTAAKSKGHLDGEAADTGAEADGDATDFCSSVKAVPRPCSAASPSPFAAFGAITRQKDFRPSLRVDTVGVTGMTRKGSDNFSDG